MTTQKTDLNELNRRMILFVIAAALFIEGVDATVINTALPQMALSLKTSPLYLKTALTAYLLTTGIFIPISGWMADKYGTQRVFSIAITVFTLGSLLCGISENLTMLVIARVIQGLGGAMSAPLARLLMLRVFPKNQLVGVASQISTIALIGPVFGPVLGGVLTTYLSWRMVFFINLPFCLTLLYLILKYVPNFKIAHVKKFDYAGFIMLAVSFVLVLFGLDAIVNPIMPWQSVAVILSSGILLFGCYILYASRLAHSVIEIKLFLHRTFRIALLGSMISRFSMAATPFLMPLLLQLNFGLSAFYAGALMTPLMLSTLMMKLKVKNMISRFGFKRILIINNLLLGTFYLIFGILTQHLSIALLLVLLFAYGFPASLQYSSMNALAYLEVPDEYASDTSSILSAMQQISACFGIAISAAILEYFLGSRNIDTYYSAAAFMHTFFCLSLLPLAATLVFLRLDQKAGQVA